MTQNNKLPKDWKWVKLGDLTQKVNKVKRKEVSEEEELIYLDIGGIDNSLNKIVTHKNYLWKDAPSRAQQIVEVEDILFSTVRTYMKNIAIVDKKIYQHQIASSGFTVLRANKKIIYKYIFYLSISDIFLNPLNELQTGSSYPAVRDTDVLNQKVSLPPLSTQNLIVSKIEELFSELDKGIEDLKTAQQQLKTYRQSVLKYAFEGKLTNEKVKDGVLPKGWKVVNIEDIAKVGTGATPLKGNKKFYENGKIAWVTSGALNDEFVRTATDYVTEVALKETNLSIYPKHTLLLAMYGEGKTRGKCSELLIEATTNQAIAAISFENHDIKVKPFLKYFLLKNYNDIRMLSSGGVQPNLNLGIVKKTSLPFPPIEEQHQIVQEIESRLSVADKMEESINQSLQQAEALRQSILKKAFSGELV